LGLHASSGSGIHSLWSNGNICLFVQGPDLKRLNPDCTATTVLPGVGPARMVYVEVAGTVCLTNGTVIGYVREGAFTTFPDPGQKYKTPMIPGHLIEYFNGRLYVTRDNEIWFSDPMALGRTDERRNFKQLPSRVTLLCWHFSVLSPFSSHFFKPHSYLTKFSSCPKHHWHGVESPLQSINP